MGYCQFLNGLLGEGRVALPPPDSESDEDFASGDAILGEYELIWRRDLPEPVPNFDLAAGRWAAARMYQACQFAVNRDVDEETIQNALATRFQGKVTAEVVYSVDFTKRFLPDVGKFSRTTAERDPLVTHLKKWARQWPLSSVGITDIGDLTITEFADHPGLMQLYVDRILFRGDVSRLNDQRVLSQVESSLGMFPELAPSVASILSALKKVERQGE